MEDSDSESECPAVRVRQPTALAAAGVTDLLYASADWCSVRHSAAIIIMMIIMMMLPVHQLGLLPVYPAESRPGVPSRSGETVTELSPLADIRPCRRSPSV